MVLLGADERRLPDGGPDHRAGCPASWSPARAGRHPQRLRIQRLKDKLGNRANASSEIEYHDARRSLVGEEGRGVPHHPDLGEYTRLDFAVGSAGLMRPRSSQALHYADHRTAFGRRLVASCRSRPRCSPTWRWSGPARPIWPSGWPATEDRRDDESERLLGRILTPVAKYWNCKRAPLVTEEAIECIGGNGYIEEHPLPRYYREAPLNAIWEGTSNIMVLDVQRVLTREPKAIEPLLDEIRAAAARAPGSPRRPPRSRRPRWRRPPGQPQDAGARLVSQIALAVQAALLVRHATPAVADAFFASRLDGDWAPTFGTLPAAADTAAIIEYARLG